MKTLRLNHIQRLNIYALIGIQKAAVTDMRAWWKIQDLLELTEEEKTQIGYKVNVLANGVEVPHWENGKTIPEKEFEVTDAQVKRIKALFETWENFTPNDRKWLSSLLEQLGVEDKE